LLRTNISHEGIFTFHFSTTTAHPLSILWTKGTKGRAPAAVSRRQAAGDARDPLWEKNIEYPESRPTADPWGCYYKCGSCGHFGIYIYCFLSRECSAASHPSTSFVMCAIYVFDTSFYHRTLQ
jgi:hypothetical protein